MRAAGEPSDFRAPAPAARAAVALVSGIALGARATSGSAEALLLAGLCAVLLFSLRRRGAGGGIRRSTGVLLFLALGFVEGRRCLAVPARQAEQAFAALPPSPERVDRVEGVLMDFWTGTPPRAHGRLSASRLWNGVEWRPFPAEVLLFVSGEAPVAGIADRGDRVVAVGKLRLEGLPASDRDIALPWPVYRLSVKSALRIESPRPTFLSWLAAPNRWLFARLAAARPGDEAFDRDVRGPLAAILLGRTSGLDRGMVARYRRGGLYHLLVIAGLHVGLAAGMALLALRLVSIRGNGREGALLAVVVIFVLVGGANPPAVRAGIVFSVFLATRLLERPVAPAQAIGLSALILIGAAPAQLYAIGTLLTFAAVCGIAAFAGLLRHRLPRRPAFLFSGLAAAVAAQIGTAPLLLWRFNVVSGGAWITAPLAIPIAGGLIAVGAAILFCLAAGIPAGAPIFLFAAGSRTLESLAERTAGVAFLRPTPPLAAALAVWALLALGMFLRGRGRASAFACAAVLFFFLAVRAGPAGPARGFSLEALDVGQGDAFLLRWGRHAVLVDGGGPFDLEARDFGRTRLLPKLLDRGVCRLDATLVTHPHPDHALGIFAVLDEIPVGALWTSEGDDENGLYRDLSAAAARRGVPVRRLRRGSVARWADASLSILRSGGPRTKKDATNNQSAVGVFERQGRRALLTGDAGAAAEADLLRTDRGRLPADVLKVGHHGSRGSTLPSFLAAVSPRAALVSCGRENRFGHPAPETLASLAAARVRVFRTDLDSDILLELFPGGTRVHKRELP
ncbi:MAG: ComEC/Rec2 family competence protein [Acidobacteriota bacterium]|nr:ComEC/Rec2 family competence protein [Acidobacteriota bacterium]